ncbi:Ran GTPase-activating protein 1 [Fasciola gigantica]|uniref:Ran GTPase-activating protein 1 n=1 Tax=Fasciola gigantica TaxID=46835 RepID=A0A504YLS8_FASGI|nr:Ran GTPase-activating protein 1 [Fasciola gigantica]
MCAPVVDFSGLALKLDEPKDVEKIVEALVGNPDAFCFNLSGSTLGIAAAEPIGIALEHNTKLQRCLWSDLFTGRLKSEIAPALRHLSTGVMASGACLVELDLSDNAFGPNGVIGVVDLIASPACATLQILRMNNQGLGHEGCRHLVEALQKGRKASGGRGLRLKVFSAGRNRLENYGARLLSDVLSDMGSLEEVSLYQNGIGIHGIEGVNSLVKMMEKNAGLRILNLSDNTLTEKGGKAIAKALCSLPDLEELHLGDCLLRASGVAALARALEDPELVPNIRVLNLTGNEINRSVGISLILSLENKSKLQLLDLNANEFGTSGIQAIIRTLDSVGLLHVLPQKSSSVDHNESVGDANGDDEGNPFASAFDEDQGSGDEQDEDDVSDDEDLGCEHGDEADSYGGYEEDEEEEPDYEDDADVKESSFNTVQERPIVKPNFSFRALDAAMGDVCSPKVENEASVKPGPFGRGLFAALGPSPEDGSGAESTRCSLWSTNPVGPAPGLFSSLTNSGMTFGKGQHLFSPPVLSVPPISSPNQQQQLTNGTTPAIIDATHQLDSGELTVFQLKCCLTDLKQTAPVDRLISTLNNKEMNEFVLPLDRIRSAIQTAEPEDVIRLALSLCRHADGTNSNQTSRDCVWRFAVNLLASALVPNASHSAEHRDTTAATSRSSRAANCLLVHLGAIKAEKNSEDDMQVRKLNPSTWEQRRVIYLSALRQLVRQYGDQLKDTAGSTCNSIRFLLAQQGEHRRSNDNQVAKIPTEADRLQDDLVTLLETQLARVQI